MKRSLFACLGKVLHLKRAIIQRPALGEPRKILVCRTDRLGDFILSLPAIYALHKTYPQAQISLLINPAYRDLVRFLPGVSQVISYRAQAGLLEKLRVLRAIRKERFNVSFDLCHGDTLQVALLNFLAGIRYRIGYDVGRHGFLFTHTMKDDNAAGTYEVDVALNVVRLAVPQLRAVKQVPFDVSLDEWSQFQHNLLAQHCISSSDRVLGVALGVSDSNPLKAWDIAKFGQVLEQIYKKSPQLKVVITGTKEDQRLFDQLPPVVQENVINLIGQTKVEELCLWLKRCDYYLSNNTGTMQLAAWVNTPTIVINGPSSIVRWAPRGEQHKIISKRYACSYYDCDGRQCDKNFACIKDISVEDVLKEVVGALGAPQIIGQ